MSEWKRASIETIRNLRISIKTQNQVEIIRFCSFLIQTRNNGGIVYLIAKGRSLDVLNMFGSRIKQPPIDIPNGSFSKAKPRIRDVDSALICTGTGETDDVIRSARDWLKINQNVGLISSVAAKDYPSKIFSIVTHPNVIILLPGITRNNIDRRRKFPDEVHTPFSELFPNKDTLVPSPTIFELSAIHLLENLIPQLLKLSNERK
jgi:hypothetical protein